MNNPLKNIFNSDKPSRKEINAFADAAAHGDNAAVEGFIKKFSAYVDKKDKSGHTALMRAALEGRKSTVILLLKAGADPKKETRHYDHATAFLCADRRDHKEVAAVLRHWPNPPPEVMPKEAAAGEKKKAAPAPKH
jgi:ankyrin repeat protein